MEIVRIISTQTTLDPHSSITGHTINFIDQTLSYTRVGVFAESNDISTKQLKRYRDQIESDLPKSEHRLYFHKVDETYFYTDKILEKRKYKISGSNTNSESIHVNHTTYPYDGVVLANLQKQSWNYAGGLNYVKEIQVEDCVQNMKDAHQKLQEKFPDSSITMYYTTEAAPDSKKPHNHFTLSVKGRKPPTISQIRKAFGSVGSEVPWVKDYDSSKDYIAYITKQIHQFPDGWGIITNSENDLAAI